MKKLKIFLLLSILLCFGLFFNNNVSASSGGGGAGPKIFEAGDILPATTQLRISWVSDLSSMQHDKSITVNNGTYKLIVIAYSSNIWIRDHTDYGNGGDEQGIKIYDDDDGFIVPYTNYDGNHPYCDIDTSTWDINYRTIFSIGTGMDGVFTWEDLNAPTVPSNAKPFEVGDVLPAGYIKISWDFTDVPFGDNDDFWIYSSGDFFIHIWKIDRLTIDIMHEEFFANTPGEIVITLSSPYTITSFDGDSNYYDYIDEALSWEVVDYADGYTDGYETARRYFGWVDDTGHWYTADEWGIMSYEHAREEFGYYDPITDRWLSVEEYLDLYTGQDGFYNNFDKYFIPAMIIVFGSAIVLTILKVFKGRE